MPIAQILFSCGRGNLDVGGVVVSMQGDPCRDMDIEYIPELKEWDPGPRRVWTIPMLREAAKRINEANRGPLLRLLDQLRKKETD